VHTSVEVISFLSEGSNYIVCRSNCERLLFLSFRLRNLWKHVPPNFNKFYYDDYGNTTIKEFSFSMHVHDDDDDDALIRLEEEEKRRHIAAERSVFAVTNNMGMFRVWGHDLQVGVIAVADFTLAGRVPGPSVRSWWWRCICLPAGNSRAPDLASSAYGRLFPSIGLRLFPSISLRQLHPDVAARLSILTARSAASH
jgi:hypothetical protein